MKSVSLYWWKPPSRLKKIINPRYWKMNSNFGDELSHLIVSKVISDKVTLAEKEDNNKLLGLGSIMHFAKDGDTIWGTGINGKMLDFNIPKINALCVRGPKTRQILIDQGISCPEIYGDPGILTSRYHKIETPRINEYAIVPHFSELNHPEILKHKERVINPTDSLENVIKKIAQSQLIISSSLHGIIVAESYGVPAVLLRITENEPLFKYEDYYMGTGRDLTSIGRSVNNALGISPQELPDISSFNFDYELINWHSDYV